MEAGSIVGRGYREAVAWFVRPGFNGGSWSVPSISTLFWAVERLPTEGSTTSWPSIFFRFLSRGADLTDSRIELSLWVGLSGVVT